MQPISGDMEALLLYQPGRFEVTRVPVPAIGPEDVLVRVAWCGVCGSDLPRFFETGGHGSPRICGHEFSGVIAAVGPEAPKTLRPGHPVVVFPLLWCGQCRACEQGRYSQCTGYDYLGSRSDGGFAEFVRAPARNVLPLPEGVTLDIAALVEPAAVALHAVRRAGGSGPYDTAVVFGCGPIGILTGVWLRALGVGRLIMIDIDPQRLDFAAEFVGAEVLNAGEQDAAGAVREAASGLGADLVVDAAGTPKATAAAVASAAPGGRVVFLGNPTGDLHLPRELTQQILRRELRIYGTWNAEYRRTDGNDDWHAVVRSMARGDISLEPLITHRMPLARAPEALEMLRTRAEFAIKVLIGNSAG